MPPELQKALYTVGLGTILTIGSCGYTSALARIDRLEAQVPSNRSQIERLQQSRDDTNMVVKRIEDKLDWLMQHVALRK